MLETPACVHCDKDVCPGEEFEGRPMCDNCAEGLEEKRETLLDLVNNGQFN
jgi:hypothetical protein